MLVWLSPMSTAFDSTEDTKQHIAQVAYRLGQFGGELAKRADKHDRSKLEEPEKSGFDAYIPKLKDIAYGSEEYRAALREIKPILEHHYAANSHHPEYYGSKGITGMSLLDVVEMLCDWKASSERMKDGGSIAKSIVINQPRFHIPSELCDIFVNTAVELGWITPNEKPPVNHTLDFIYNFNALAECAHKNSVDHGFWENPETQAGMLALIHEEVSECLTALRHGNGPSDHIPEFTGAEEELADAIIRIMDMSTHHKWRVADAIVAKMKFNESRPYKHGKKF